ncbi:L-threonylcarbamoyladenylate synthase [Deinococcus maricopensis]|uniref:L-threonylcarbamoyladenylate synthase n=1 Tax=Deinococcus maricopensis (strain DSM 21211 / LMG 22137 / NRRL B-23946 / LB-34) TaxID=709986 RepID=E8U6Y7_DEIML|nr:L-threonylcarbamoyladenylate synthase [Deinococcus maricopensis]ADV66826.1 Sua5/YciO/YrdC/YwlC family protein [Deinococcus maricopensis DSM 21211]
MSAEDQVALERARVAVLDGRLIGFATETVWALACAAQPDAVARLAAAKGRPEGKPFQVLCADPARAASFFRLDERLRARFLTLAPLWPGPLTLVAPASPLAPAALVSNGRVGVRVPDHVHAHAVLNAVGGALAASSLNLSGEVAASTFEQALAYALADVLLPGPDAAGLASTVVDLETGVVLREGAVRADAVREALACTP